jgi:hypothetical protein
VCVLRATQRGASRRSYWGKSNFNLACLHLKIRAWRLRACVCFEAEGKPDGRMGIIVGQGLHADNSAVISNIRRENLKPTHRRGRAFEEGSSAECVNCSRAISFTRNSKSRFLRIAFGNQTISPASRASRVKNPRRKPKCLRDSRLCVLASRRVCHYRVQSLPERSMSREPHRHAQQTIH